MIRSPTEMEIRVANAICHERGIDPEMSYTNPGEQPRPQYLEWLGEARSAIRAMRKRMASHDRRRQPGGVLMNILITGGCGHLGSVLVPKLLERGHKIWAPVSTVRRGLDPHKNLRVLQGGPFDIAWPHLDIVIHLATNTADPWGAVLTTERLAAATSRAGVRQFIFASTADVYGPTERPATEDLPLAPVSVYAQAKMVAERVLLSYAERMSVQILRQATVCGLSPRMRLDTTVNRLTMQALNRGRITVTGGAQIQPYMHIADMADLYCFMIEHPELTGVFNAAAENLSVAEVATFVATRTRAEIVVQPSNDVGTVRVDSGNLGAAGFVPKRSVSQAIGEMTMAHNVGELIEADEMYGRVA